MPATGSMTFASRPITTAPSRDCRPPIPGGGSARRAAPALARPVRWDHAVHVERRRLGSGQACAENACPHVIPWSGPNSPMVTVGIAGVGVQAVRVDDRSERGALVAASIAASLGTASAAVSAYWALGGTALLDTVGGEFERSGRERSAGVMIALWVIVALKLVGAAAPLVFAGVGAGHLPAWTKLRPARLFGWSAALGLTLYG